MGVLALVLLLIVGLGVLAGLHNGPHGLLGAGTLGAILCTAFLIGLLALAGPGVATPLAWALVSGATAVSVSAVGAGLKAVASVHRQPPSALSGGLWGADGVALTSMNPTGTVRVRGETWTAESVVGALPAGAPVHVLEVNGLRLRVWSDEAVTQAPPPEQETGEGRSG